VQDHIDEMVRAGVQTEQLAIQHMREGGERMPVADLRPRGESCVLSAARLGGPLQWMCGDSKGRGEGGALCTSFDPTSCDSGACFGAACAAPCARSTDCLTETACAMEEVSLLLPPSVVRVAICSASSATERLCCTSMDCGGQACRPRAASSGSVMACQVN
jgi:hypothetical protein